MADALVFEEQLLLLEIFPYSTQCAYLFSNLRPASNLTLKNDVLSSCLQPWT